MKLSILKKFLIVFCFSLFIVTPIKPGVYANEKCVTPCYAARCYFGVVDCDFFCILLPLSVCFDKNGDIPDLFEGDILDIQKGGTYYIITYDTNGDKVKDLEVRLKFLGCNDNPCSKLIGTFRIYQDGKEVARCCVKGYEETSDNSAALQGSAQGLSSALENLKLRLK